jgi:hypothetical protein
MGFEYPGVTDLLLHYFGRAFFVRVATARSFGFGSTMLTRSGRELLSISGATESPVVLNSVLDQLRSSGFDMKEVDVTSEPDGRLRIQPKVVPGSWSIHG